MSAKTVSKRLRQARKARGLSANALDLKAKLARGHVRQIENGQKASIELATATKLAVALDVSMDWLTTGKGQGPTTPPDSTISVAGGGPDDVDVVHSRAG